MFFKVFLCSAVLFLVSAVFAGQDVRLLIPEKIYAVPGVETNIYFNNVVTVINPANPDRPLPQGRQNRHSLSKVSSEWSDFCRGTF